MWEINGDPATHIGWVTEVLRDGHVPSDVIYPITHIYLSAIISITNYSMVPLLKIIPLIFSLLCVVYIFLFIRVIATNPIEPIIGVLIACAFTYSGYLNFMPNCLLNLFFPCALLLMFHYIKQITKNWLILFLFIIVLFPVFHPVPTIFLGIILLTMWMPLAMLHLSLKLKKRTISTQEIKFFGLRLFAPVLVLIIWFIFWTSLFDLWGWTITDIYQSIRLEGELSQLRMLTDQYSAAQTYGYSVLEQFFRRLSGLLILFLFSALSLPVLWNRYSHGEEGTRHLFALYGPLGVLSAILPALYFLDLGFSPFRFTIYVAILGTAFTAYFISVLLIVSRGKIQTITSNIIVISIALLLIILFCGGLLNLYPSPYNMALNQQTPYTEVTGMEHFYDYKSLENGISVISVAPGRYADLFLTPEQRASQKISRFFVNQEDKTPWHFGYDKYSSLSSSYDVETYLIVTQRDKIIYKDALPEMAQYRFECEDFERLKNDPGVDFLYVNGGLDLLRIIA